MDSEIDTAQRRAEAIVDGLIEMTPGTTARLELIDRLILFEQQARRAALEAVIADIRKALQLYGNDEWRERKALQEWIDHFVERNNKVALDRLREGVGNE